MATFKINQSHLTNIQHGNETIEIVKKEVYDNFNQNLLGLGKIRQESTQTNALSVIFDLEGFTRFCKQIDPQLAVPEYLNEFLPWIFEEIRTELVDEVFDEGYTTWSHLPFLAKYLGDGILFLWDTHRMDEQAIVNIVVIMYQICQNYTDKFLPKISSKIISPPPKLRCGISRGTIYSVGDENDYVGPCINMSARLQKLHALSFCFSRRGIDPEKMDQSWAKTFVIKKVDVRGIGNDELVCVCKSDFESLPPDQQAHFKDT